jgi:AcrR family transcriptional regulator
MYRHFANADDLIVELFRREVVDKRFQVRDALESNPDRSSEAGFRAFFRRWTEDDNYALLDLLTQTTTVSGRLREAQENLTIQSEEYFSRLYQARLGLPEGSAKIAATLVLAALKGSIRSWDCGYGTEEEIERVFVAVIDGGLRTLVNRESQRLEGRPRPVPGSHDGPGKP